METYLLAFERSNFEDGVTRLGLITVEGTYKEVADLVARYMEEDGINRCFICKVLQVVELKESEQKDETQNQES